MIVRNLKDLAGTDREVKAPTFASRRLLLKRDGMGFSMHDTLLYAGMETLIWYANHLEAVYCVEGEGEIEVLETGEIIPIKPGTFYALDGHEKHKLRAFKDLRAVCVFTPALTGREVHDENGVYPLIEEEDPAPARRAAS